MIIFILWYFNYEYDNWKMSKISDSKEWLESIATERGWTKDEYFIEHSFCTVKGK